MGKSLHSFYGAYISWTYINLCVCVCASLSSSFEGGIWDLIVYFSFNICSTTIEGNVNNNMLSEVIILIHDRGTRK